MNTGQECLCYMQWPFVSESGAEKLRQQPAGAVEVAPVIFSMHAKQVGFFVGGLGLYAQEMHGVNSLEESP